MRRTREASASGATEGAAFRRRAERIRRIVDNRHSSAVFPAHHRLLLLAIVTFLCVATARWLAGERRIGR